MKTKTIEIFGTIEVPGVGPVEYSADFIVEGHREPARLTGHPDTWHEGSEEAEVIAAGNFGTEPRMHVTAEIAKLIAENGAERAIEKFFEEYAK